jgi:hypothetical protein
MLSILDLITFVFFLDDITPMMAVYSVVVCLLSERASALITTLVSAQWRLVVYQKAKQTTHFASQSGCSIN